MTTTNRRDFLRHAGSLALGLTAMGRASAAVSPGYKALVCIYLYGGNDAYNTVLATDEPSWSNYLDVRSTDSDPLALLAPGTPVSAATGASTNAQLGGVLPIAPAQNQGRSFALHPSLASVRDLFAAQRLAIVANIGPLARPTTKAAYLARTAVLPPKLFSHNDQQSVWQTMSTEGNGDGWGGRMADLMASGNSTARFTALSMSGQAAWLDGRLVLPYQLSPGGAIHIGPKDNKLFGSAVAQQKLMALMKSSRAGHVLEADVGSVVARSVEAEALLAGTMPAIGAGPWGTAGIAASGIDPLLQYRDPFTRELLANPLAKQLQGVARMIATRSALGMNRQIFFVALDGFDTHDEQNWRHARNLARLAQGLTYFDNVLRSMGLEDDVTTFTASDFGRTLTSNGDGTDHGWGGHQFVMGGAVRGGNIYGRFPTYGAAQGNNGYDSNDQINNGVLLPGVPVEAYAAAFGAWMGLSDSQLLSILPALAQWPAPARRLSFLG